MSTTASAYACATFCSPGRPEEPEDRDGKRRAVGSREEHRGAELAERDRERKAGSHGESARDDRQVDLPAHSPGRRAEQRCRLALMRVDRSQGRSHDPHDERDRDERLRDRHDPRRGSEVERVGVEGDEEPEAEHHGRDAEGKQHKPVEHPRSARVGYGERGEPADDHAR